MKKKHLLAKTLLAFSLLVTLCGCTSLDYVDNDVQNVQASRVQTSENFNFQIFNKSIGDVNIKAGISETVLDSALVLYMAVENNSDTSFKFDMDDILVTSPIGEVSKIPPAMFIDGFYNHEASSYITLARAGSSLGNFATIQNRYRMASTSPETKIENISTSPELTELEKTIEGIQRHTISSYKFISPNTKEYFYVFLRKPDEYPIVVNYKNLTYKFGGKKNVQE